MIIFQEYKIYQNYIEDSMSIDHYLFLKNKDFVMLIYDTYTHKGWRHNDWSLDLLIERKYDLVNLNSLLTHPYLYLREKAKEFLEYEK